MVYHAVFGQVELLGTALSVVADIDLVRTVLIVFLGNIDIVAVVHDIKDIIAVGDNVRRIYGYFFRFGFRRLSVVSSSSWAVVSAVVAEVSSELLSYEVLLSEQPEMRGAARSAPITAAIKLCLISQISRR